MKPKELEKQVPAELRELICGLDDEDVCTEATLPISPSGLVDYKAQVTPSPLDFDISAMLKGDPNSEIKFSDLPISDQLPMGISETGEFVETHSPLNKKSLCDRFVTQIGYLANEKPEERAVLKRFAEVLEGEQRDFSPELATAANEFKQSLVQIEAAAN